MKLNKASIVSYHFIVAMSEVLSRTAVWHILSLLRPPNMPQYYALQTFLHALGGFAGGWLFASVTRSKGIRYAFTRGSILSACCYGMTLISICFNSLELFLLTRFLAGALESSDSTLSAETLLHKDQNTISQHIHARGALYSIVYMLLSFVIERICVTSGESAIIYMLPIAYIYSLLAVPISATYRENKVNTPQSFAWDIPINMKLIAPLLPYLLFELASNTTLVILPLIIKQFLDATYSVTVISNRVDFISELLAISYSILFSYVKRANLPPLICMAATSILFFTILLLPICPHTLVYFLSFYGILDASYESRFLESVGTRHTKEQIPYMCSAISMIQLFAKIFSSILIFLLPLHICLYVVAFLQGLMIIYEKSQI